MGVPVEHIQRRAIKSILSHPVGKELVDEQCEKAVQANKYTPLVAGVQSFWKRLSNPKVSSTMSGIHTRRSFCSGLAGPGVTFPLLKSFLGGTDIKKDTFDKAVVRRSEFMDEWDPALL